MNYSWPGNVRELENAIEHALVMGSSDSILPIDLPAKLFNEDYAKDKIGSYGEAVCSSSGDWYGMPYARAERTARRRREYWGSILITSTVSFKN